MSNLGKKKINEARLKKRIEKIKKTKNLYLGLFLLSFLIITSTLFFYLLPKIGELGMAKTSIMTNDEQIKMKQDEKKTVKEKLEEKTKELEDIKEQLGPKLSIIFPEEENIFDLTKFLEDYSTRFHSEENPMILNNINYGDSKLSDDGQYYILPVRMNMQASEGNFANFLNMVSQSGSLDEKNYFKEKPIRLMTIENMNVSLPKYSKSKKDEKKVNVFPITIEINTYFKNKNSTPGQSPPPVAG